MFSSFPKVLSIGLCTIYLAGCSPAEEHTASSDSFSKPVSMTFDWQVPARLNVRETTAIAGKEFKVKYDLMIEKHVELEGHLVLSFANATPIEFDGQQVNTSVYPQKLRQQIKMVLMDFHTRPGLVLGPGGELVDFVDIDKSVRALVEITQFHDKATQQKIYETAIADPELIADTKKNSENIWSCLIKPWLGFTTPLNKSSEQAISIVLAEGARPAPATLTKTNRGFVENSDSIVELVSVTLSSGVDLAKVMLELTLERAGRSEALPDIEGVVTATSNRTSKVRLNPTNMRPEWARCENEFSIDSNDSQIVAPVRQFQYAEYEIQWL